MFGTVLVANRGEIALRILSTLQDHGIETVVTASDADLNSGVTRRADNVLHLDGVTALKTYLDIDQIVSKAKEMGIHAVHPGYGFLAENPLFAKAVEDAGMKFIGPTYKQMKIFGDKLEARQLAIKTGTPLVEGTKTEMSDDELFEFAKQIGFPVLIKASAGGGGRGIRQVNKESEFAEQLSVARNEAKLAFNDERVFVEKFIKNGRHIEVQILGDPAGNVFHFAERDCTMQRKNQKLIEEAPAPTITRKKAKEIHETAVNLTQEIGYQNAGTVEFLYEPSSNKHYFLEVNARIQVEHPVTEFITGEDLIWRQLQVAADELTNLNQKDLRIKGHAIEARIYAENPNTGFTPSPGQIRRVKHPIGPGVRVDSAVEDGSVITPYYDSMVSKLIVHAHDRTAAIHKLTSALDDYLVSGVHTTIGFIRDLLMQKEFSSGNYHTKYLDTIDLSVSSEIENIARALAANLYGGKTIVKSKSGKESVISKWRTSTWPSDGGTW